MYNLPLHNKGIMETILSLSFTMLFTAPFCAQSNVTHWEIQVFQVNVVYYKN